MADLPILKNFREIIDIIGEKSPLQKKRINKYIVKKDRVFFEEVEVLAENYIKYLKNQQVSLESAIDFYLKLCCDMMSSRLYFMKTDSYPTKESKEFVGNLYKDKAKMKSYMIGLAISQLLWATHYDMYRFLKKYLEKNKDSIHSYLEIGSGHGLFLNMAMDCLQEDAHFYAIDISPVSIEVTKSIIEYFKPRATNIRYNTIDLLELNVSEKFDFITMGEVLEHADCPVKLLNKINELLTPEGKSFISTCVNCPAIDHTYHFRTTDEIRNMFRGCGLIIERELVLPVEDLPREEIINKKITINYCAILRKGEENGKI